VVYDADKRYREQCFDLAADKVRVVDASEAASKAARRRCWHCARWATQGTAGRVLIYVPTKRPETDEQKQADPFACTQNAARCSRKTMATST
jgi:hypothetical protein